MHLSVLTRKHADCESQLASLRALRHLFVIVPADIMCGMDPDRMRWQTDNGGSREERLLTYLQELANRMEGGIRHFPRALWSRSIGGFVSVVVKYSDPEEETAYFSQGYLEHSFARCLFNPDSGFRVKIDSQLKEIFKLPAERMSGAFLELCKAVCRKITRGRKTELTGKEESVLALVVFRVLFNRAYEQDTNRFAPGPESAAFVRTAAAIGDGPASALALPWVFLPEGSDEDGPLRAIFTSDPIYREASEEFSMALFEPNPMDQIHRIHSGLLAVARGASKHSPEMASMLLGFDDHFTLSFGSWMCSEMPDAQYLWRMIDQYAPKNVLSSTFEYAVTYLEVVVLHIKQFSVVADPRAVSR
jgi:hypothetical protein